MKSSRLFPVLLAVLSLSCTSARELARRSAVALQGGDSDAAYDWARRAIEKDPRSDVARAALYEAVQLRARDWKTRIQNLADVDSLAAAEQTLVYADFRAEVVRYRAPVEPDTRYQDAERDLRASAARTWFGRAESSMESARPKRASAEYSEVARFAPQWPGIADSIHASRERGTMWIAVLPLENQTGRSELARQLTEHWYDELASGLRGAHLQFTRLVPLDESWDASGGLRGRDRGAVIDAGRALEADQVLTGRVYGLDSDTRTTRIADFVYRRVSYRDTSGRTLDRYEQIPFEAVLRERHVRVSLEYELISTASGRSLTGDDVTRELEARTAYSTFLADGPCDRYCWVPPRGKYLDGDEYSRAQNAERRWKESGPIGETALPAFLEEARQSRRRREYRHEYLPSFYPNTRPWYYLDDLPPPEDLAFASLVNEWQPLFDALKEGDWVDEVDRR